MINAIGEATVQFAIRVSDQSTLMTREFENQKARALRTERSIEKSNEPHGSNMHPDRDAEAAMRTRHRIEDGKIVLERYDQEGRLVMKIPPGYVPFGEVA
jgi:hypothetical protein